MTTKLDAITRAKLIESNSKNLQRINNALKFTLQEIAFLEIEEAKTPGAYAGALTNIRTKRNRQHANATATAAYIAALKADK